MSALALCLQPKTALIMIFKAPCRFPIFLSPFITSKFFILAVLYVKQKAVPLTQRPPELEHASLNTLLESRKLSI